ncbi:hypothetical protein BH23ACT2_BH23ACT2_28160 [soil metagenome]
MVGGAVVGGAVAGAASLVDGVSSGGGVSVVVLSFGASVVLSGAAVSSVVVLSRVVDGAVGEGAAVVVVEVGAG